MSSWIAAVKEYAAQTGKWKVPKAGTPEYDAVKAIQAKLSGKGPAPVKAPVEKVVQKPVVAAPEPPKRILKIKKVSALKDATATLKAEAAKVEAAKAEEEAKKPVIKRVFKEAAPAANVDVGLSAPPKKGRKGKPKPPAMSIQKTPVSLNFD